MTDLDLKRYLHSLDKLVNGKDIDFGDFLHHFDVQNANPSTGIPVGEAVPSFQLVDQAGRMRTCRDLSGPEGLLLVFVRSVNWCGYCRNQLVELNLAADDVLQRGVGLAAVAPDEPELVRRFAEYAGLRFPMLADPGAQVIEQFGILNRNIPAESTGQNSGRIPFPGHFLIAPDGTVRDKYIADDLRHRLSGTGLVFKHYGAGASSVGVALDSGDLNADITLSSRSVQAGQQIAVRVNVTVRDGYHVYAEGADSGYAPISVSFDEDLVSAQDLVFPEPSNIHLPAIGETEPVYEGSFEASGYIRLNWSPPAHGVPFIHGLQDRLSDMLVRPGDYVLRGTLAYQACSETLCMPPREVRFELPLTIHPDIGKVAPVFKGEVVGDG